MACIQHDDVKSIEEDGSWIIAEILDHRRQGAKNEFLISWGDSRWDIQDATINEKMSKFVKIHENEMINDHTSYCNYPHLYFYD